MKRHLIQRIKQSLTLVGEIVPRRLILSVFYALSYVRLGRWLKDHDFAFEAILPNREKYWEYVANTIGNAPVLYLEFGVNRGESISAWSRLLKHPNSRLHGFDSFEGLPEMFDERQQLGKGAFDQGGNPPLINDSRVSFHKGWFSETLPTFTVPPHKHLVITMDADLYSSTIFVLRHLDPWIVPGTYIYFDDLVIIGHETQAIDEYLSESGKCLEGVAAEWTKSRAVFRCVSCPA